jgi:hypothetical protein
VHIERDLPERIDARVGPIPSGAIELINIGAALIGKQTPHIAGTVHEQQNVLGHDRSVGSLRTEIPDGVVSRSDSKAPVEAIARYTRHIGSRRGERAAFFLRPAIHWRNYWRRANNFRLSVGRSGRI